ncbi:MAG: NAD(P)H-binding protein [Chloroflexi bacterium]|nr:NAD(P)H-binding protein [Chloroflexota bacterium]
MPSNELNVVTGAFLFTGKYITSRLVAQGKRVINLTGHPHREHPFADKVASSPFNFDNPGKLVENIRGATTLYNTYWVRFPYGQVTFEQAVNNTKILLKAAKEAGVKKIVHISVSGASLDSPLPYFRGKALVEKAIMDSGFAYTIVRPTMTFGAEDILTNNIAWFLRKFPFFAIPTGNYQIQPVFVGDVADIVVLASQEIHNMIVDAAGPETYTFGEMVSLIAKKIGSRTMIVPVPSEIALLLIKFLGLLVGDIVLTRDEMEGLVANLLVSSDPPRGTTHFSQWLDQNSKNLGTHYSSELERHYRTVAKH